MPRYENDEQRQAARLATHNKQNQKGDRHTVKNRHAKKGEENYKPHSGSREKSLFERANFIAWDGEGTDIKNKKGEKVQIYSLLMNSDGNVITDHKGLSTLACLRLLTDTAQKHKSAIHVCYGASYDVNMMLRDVPYSDLEVLYGGEKIIFDRYELEYRPRKSFIVRRMPEKVSERWREKKGRDGKVTYEKVYEAKLTLWDVIGFFQGKFVKSLDSYFVKRDKNGEADMSDSDTARYIDLIAEIKKGKDRRGDFSIEEMENFIKPYCLNEVKALVALMEKLHHNLQSADLKIARWDGAGACASALLKREKIKEHMEDMKHNPFPNAVHLAAQHAYAGGRIEPLQYGHYNGPVYHYDINSAYPASMLHLPSLAKGKWKLRKKVSLSEVAMLPHFSMFKVSWAFPETYPAYPFPYRTKSGSILFPPHGKNWIWYPELLAALDTIPDATNAIAIEETWCFYPDTDVKPFAFLNDLFTLRAIWKREGNGAEKAMKLAINSVYGKMVQQLGYQGVETDENGNKTGGKPPYHQLEWGGYVTSHTRSQLFRAVMQNPTAIMSLATDGIYSTRPLSLPCSKILGEWDYHCHDDMTLVTSGVYWYTDDDSEKSYYRGFDEGTLTRENVLWSWSMGKHEYVYLSDEMEYKKGAKSTRFITLGAALLPNGKEKSKKERFKDWRTWKTIDRDLRLDMQSTVKRLEYEDYDQANIEPEWNDGTPDTRLYPTRARTIRDLRESALPFPDILTIEGTDIALLSEKYKLKWGEESKKKEQGEIDGIPEQEYYNQHTEGNG